MSWSDWKISSKGYKWKEKLAYRNEWKHPLYGKGINAPVGTLICKSIAEYECLFASVNEPNPHSNHIHVKKILKSTEHLSGRREWGIETNLDKEYIIVANKIDNKHTFTRHELIKKINNAIGSNFSS